MEKRNEQFDKGLGHVIGTFEKAKEWADLSNCLQKAKKQIEMYKGLMIPRQKDLAKRLAQCLNPEINVIHQLTLDVYKEVFEREIELMDEDKKNGVSKYQRKSSIALFFSGLFNFYQFAAFEVKLTFLVIIKDCLIKMDKELILSLPGFMICMLPALDDQNTDIIKKVEHILQETEKTVGTSEFYGEIWKAMLRTPRARLSAIKYLEKRIPKDMEHARKYRDKNLIYLSDYTIKIIDQEVLLTKDEVKQKEDDLRRQNMELHDYFYFYYPNKSQLVMNALIAGLSTAEIQVYVNRATLDFMISHMSINSQINSIRENIILVECATGAYKSRDYAAQTKISNWLFGHINEEVQEVDADDPSIIAIVESQKNLFNNSMDSKTVENVNKQSLQIGEGGQVHSKGLAIEKLIVDPIQILLRIMSEEENTMVPILKQLSIHLIKFIRFHYNNGNIEELPKFTSTLTNLLEQISGQYGVVLESLANKLEQEINNIDYSHQTEDRFQNLESIDLISFAILDMKSLQKKIFENNESKKYLTLILQNLLKGLTKISGISKSDENIELMLPSLDVIDQILIIFDESDNGETLIMQKKSENFKTSIDAFNHLFVIMSKYLIEDSKKSESFQIPLSKEQFETFKKYNNIVLKMLKYQDIDSQIQVMPEWLDMLIQSSKTRLSKYQNICIVSAEIFNDILKQENNQTMHIQRLIADPTGKSITFDEEDFTNPKQFHRKFIEKLQVYNDNFEDKNGNSHCKEIIQNLWFNLDQEIETQKIVDLLKAFDLYLPRIFSDVVIDELAGRHSDLEIQEVKQTQNLAIKKFQIFWQRVSGYPEYRPFKSPSPENDGKRYVAVHNMINFLEDTDPTLRLSSRSWLSHKKQFNRILDPIIEEFIQSQNFQITSENNVIINGSFKTHYVIQNFGKLRNIILNTQDDIIEYMMLKNCTDFILDDYRCKKLKVEKQEPTDSIDDFSKSARRSSTREDFLIINEVGDGTVGYTKVNYLEILVEITLQFIQAEHNYADMLDLSQQDRDKQLAETLTVNASACEFMELIIKQVEKHGKVSTKVAHIVIKPLIDTFYHLIQKKNYAMQVNIINLLHIVLNECNFQGTTNNKNTPKEADLIKAQCFAILTNQRLLDSIILGLKCDQGFVRQKFIKFVEMLVVYLKKFTIDNDSFKDYFKYLIDKLLDCFCNLLKRVDVTFFSSSSVNRTRGRFSTIKNRQSLHQQNKFSETQNQDKGLVINQETDIITIIEGVQIIINTCLNLKGEDDTEDDHGLDADEQARKQKLQNEAYTKQGFFSRFTGKKPLTFAPDLFLEVKRVIYDKIQNILIACIYCWNSIDMYNWNDYHSSSFGMFAYAQEDNRKILEKVRKKNLDPFSGRAFMTLDQILNEQSNPIHKKVLQLLRSIAKEIPDQFIEGALHFWLRKSRKGGNGKIDNIEHCDEKLIQILVCVYQANESTTDGKLEFIMPVTQVIWSMIKFICIPRERPIVCWQKWSKKKNPPLDISQNSSETFLNSFLYAYLTHNPSMFDQVFQNRQDEKMLQFQNVYKAMLKYFSLFKLSRNPFTIQWLLEILNIICIKFNIPESNLDNKLKKEYQELLNKILTNCTLIMTESFNILFDQQQYFNFALPPTVYEFLWRYEYMSFKNQECNLLYLCPVDQVIKGNNQAEDMSTFINSIESYSPTDTENNKQLFIKAPTIKKEFSVFFDSSTLNKLIDSKFEYQHNTGSSGPNNNDQSIFQNLEILMKDRSILSQDYMKQSDFMEKIKLAIRNGECNPADLLIQSKFFTILTLKQIVCQLLVNLVGTGDTEKCIKTMHILFHTTIQILQSDNNDLKSQAKQNQKKLSVMNEFITDFFAAVVEKSHQIDPGIIKPYRKEIVDLFNFDQFFSTSMVNLKQWQKIIMYFIDGKPDEMLEYQMEKWNITGGLFADNRKLVIAKCYAMERIAFLVFSCVNDDFEMQLDYLIKKMTDIFKLGNKSDIKERLFLIFLTRTLLLRLNFGTLTETLRKLWPHLLNELISIFEVGVENMDQDITNLTIEAIKLVQLLSSLNIEDFQINQWIFLIDGYGMKLEGQQPDQSQLINKEESKEDQLNVGSKMDELRKKQNAVGKANEKYFVNQGKTGEMNNDEFKTFIVRFIGKEEYSFYNVAVPQDGTNREKDIEQLRNENELLGVQKQQANNNVNGAASNKEQENNLQLNQQACSLQQSINDSNVLGNEFNRQETEAKIEQDFLKYNMLLKM